MKQPRIRCGDRDPEHLGSLINRAFLLLIKFDDFEGSDATLQSLVAGRPGALLSRKSLLDLARNPRIHVRNTDRALLFRFGLRIGSFDSVSISSMEFYLLIDAPAWLKKHSI